MITKKKIAVVDVCHTLYHENTTIGFINYIGGASYRIRLLRFSFIKVFLVILGKILGKDLYRILYIKNLAGKTRTELYMLALKYHDNVLCNVKIPVVHELILKNRDVFDYKLCSASLDIIISAVVERNDIFSKKYISSKLEYDKNDICTGKLAYDLLGKKATEFNSPDWVITDNISDLELIKKSKKSTVVSKRKNINFWAQHGVKVDIII